LKGAKVRRLRRESSRPPHVFPGHPYDPEMILQTFRLILRPQRGEDAAALFTILGDATAMEFWDRGSLQRLAKVEALLADELAAMAAGGFCTGPC
jgi:hypothetical protein